jgi:hypothetical protein
MAFAFGDTGRLVATAGSGRAGARTRTWARKASRLASYGLCTSWARVPPIRDRVLAQTTLAEKPVLVISLPRSGSSWVGEIMGHAEGALYLHEPLTQTFHRTKTEPTLIEPEKAARWYRPAAQSAFAGLPLFNPWVVRIPAQWKPSARNGRKLVVKEVNPLLCGWLSAAYQPRVVLLVRHPAAVALSYRRMGWFDLAEFQMGAPGESPWKRHGRRQGHVLGQAISSLEENEASFMIVRYEDVCLRPQATFRKLFDFAGLRWTPEVQQLVRSKSSGGDRRAVFATERHSRSMVEAWRDEIHPRHLDDVLDGYGEAGRPLYEE